jgi:EAL domain-containing protein (putative c-di-GMP-specific phosphodiesterase class I)
MFNTLLIDRNLSKNTELPVVKTQDNFHSELVHAIKNNDLRLQYQPRYNTKMGQSVIFEALVRWQHPTRGLLPPDSFIPVAEEHGLICKLGLWVFEKCCKDIIKLRHQLNQKIKIAVNVSLLQCEDSLHITNIYDICQKHNLDFNDFEFELTESKSIKNKSKVMLFCKTLRKLGADISLDDFGTGFSPLNNLCDLPINTIKIDKCFTDKIGRGGRDEILINHLIELAHEMDIKVVAEGVEHAYQQEHLIAMGCDQLQGFYMCKPLDPADISVEHIKMNTSY